MNKHDRSVPDGLKGFVPRPAPPHVRQKALAAAEGIRPVGRFLTPAQWGMADRAGLEELLGADQARSLRLQSTRPRRDQAIWMEGRMDKDALAFEEKEDADGYSKNPR